MYFKRSCVVILVLFFCSCKDIRESPTHLQDTKRQQHITVKDLGALNVTSYELDAETLTIVNDWKSYQQIENLVNTIKKGELHVLVDGEEDLKLVLKRIRNDLPKEIKNQSVLARILVLETKLLKLKSFYSLTTTTKQELLNRIQEFLLAFENLNFQINKKVEFDARIIEKP